MSTTIRNLSPTTLWNNFADLNEVPRPSKKEEKVIAFMKSFGESLHLETLVDNAGNVIIKKQASAGKEDRPTVILQAHLDMVHQKNADTKFDFDNEGIRCFVDGEWVKAEGTTLGADNGIGVAAIMTLLQSTDIPHPPIEALFTIDEETGMTGAKALSSEVLNGTILLNLDSEEDDELTIGCAGGVDTNTRYEYKEVDIPEEGRGFRVWVKGLKGGHSGLDIHLGRGNANKLLARLLYEIDIWNGRLASFDGGSLRNAIPREASATLFVREGNTSSFQEELERRAMDIKEEFQQIEPDMEIDWEEVDTPTRVMDEDEQDKIIKVINALQNGVYRMTPGIPGLVETSSSLARVIIKDGVFITQSLQRSSIESGKEDVARAIRSTFELIGAEVENDGYYPGWAPNTESNVLSMMVDLYNAQFGGKPKVSACHAGLECGIIAEHYPKLDMISFGPTIRHPHSPDEKVHIGSVEKFWRYLTKALDKI